MVAQLISVSAWVKKYCDWLKMYCWMWSFSSSCPFHRQDIHLRSKETHRRWNFLNIFWCFDVSDLRFSVKNPRGQVDNWTLNWYILVALITFEHCSSWNAYFIDKMAIFFFSTSFYAHIAAWNLQSPHPQSENVNFEHYARNRVYKFLCTEVLSLRLIFDRKARDRSGAMSLCALARVNKSQQHRRPCVSTVWFNR